jgi:hypothetical protein
MQERALGRARPLFSRGVAPQVWGVAGSFAAATAFPLQASSKLAEAWQKPQSPLSRWPAAHVAGRGSPGWRLPEASSIRLWHSSWALACHTGRQARRAGARLEEQAARGARVSGGGRGGLLHGGGLGLLAAAGGLGYVEPLAAGAARVGHPAAAGARQKSRSGSTAHGGTLCFLCSKGGLPATRRVPWVRRAALQPDGANAGGRPARK